MSDVVGEFASKWGLSPPAAVELRQIAKGLVTGALQAASEFAERYADDPMAQAIAGRIRRVGAEFKALHDLMNDQQRGKP